MTAKKIRKSFDAKVKTNRRAIRLASRRAGRHFDRYVVEQFSKMRHVKRPVLAWLLLIVVLMLGVFLQTRQLRSHYIDEVPVSGGVLKEGMVGEVTNINPLYTASTSDESLSRLIFSSLVKYDENGDVVGDLARKWTSNSSGSVYTFTLRENAKWHDGQPVTADDVVFTFDMLQHPDAGSPLATSWRGVKVVKESEYVVVFNLPNSFAPFTHSLANLGVIPKHILGDVRPDQLRGHRFNLADPIGSGPFKFVESLVVGRSTDVGSDVVRFKLVANRSYHFGVPRLDGLQFHTYGDREEMITAFNEGELAFISGLVASDIPRDEILIEEIVEISEEELGDEGVNLDEGVRTTEEGILENIERTTLETESASIQAVPRASQVMIFLNTTDPLLKDKDVRLGLASAVQRQEILALADSRYIVSRGPLLEEHLGYNEKNSLASYNPDAAAEHFDEAGWKLNKEDGFRYKDKKRLQLNIISQADDIFPEILAALQVQLKEVGVDVTAKIVNSEIIQQDYLAQHNYQALLFGINLGHDSDQYAFWHSSQRGLNGRNLSNYNSLVVDNALEAGRTRIDENLRIAKYETFAKRWVSDVPAIPLYQPTYIFTHKKQVSGVEVNTVSRVSDRYHDVHKWTVSLGQAEKLY